MLLLRRGPGLPVALGAPLSAAVLAAAACAGSGVHEATGGDAGAPEDRGAASAAIETRLPAGLAAVWATDDGDKIERHDLAHPARLGSPVWIPGVGIDLWALRNETVAFQVVLEGDEAGACCLKVSMSGLEASNGARIRNDFTLPGADEGDLANSVGRRVEVFREVYLPVTLSSRTLFYWPGNALLGEGEWPDPLAPIQTAVDGGPYTVAPRSNQAFWVDITVPRGAEPNQYWGTFEITRASSLESYKIPVRLTVLGPALPERSALQTLFFLARPENLATRHGVDQGSPAFARLLHRYAQMMHRHRLEMTLNGNLAGDLAPLAGILNGEVFRPEEGYEGPGEGLGDRLLFVHLDTSSESDLHRSIAWWHDWFTACSIPWQAATYYVIDEPMPSEFGELERLASWAHAAPTPIATLVTRSMTPELVRGAAPEYIDIWAIPSSSRDYTGQPLRDRQAHGTRVGMYNGYHPAAGLQLIDAPAVGVRTWGWLAFQYDLDFWYTWDIARWFRPDAHVETDTWNDPLSFTDGLARHGDAENVGNGDGVILYPGQDRVYPRSDRGIFGPVASIRLKNARRGVQDHELLRMLKASGAEARARSIARATIGVGLYGASFDAPPTWPNDGASWEMARRRLLALLAKR
jgi:hypothetical protein